MKCKMADLSSVVGAVLCEDVVDLGVLDGAENQRLWSKRPRAWLNVENDDDGGHRRLLSSVSGGLGRLKVKSPTAETLPLKR